MIFSLYIIYHKIVYNNLYKTLSEYGVKNKVVNAYITHDHTLRIYIFYQIISMVSEGCKPEHQ
jgi:hypothetical protein